MVIISDRLSAKSLTRFDQSNRIREHFMMVIPTLQGGRLTLDLVITFEKGREREKERSGVF